VICEIQNPENHCSKCSKRQVGKSLRSHLRDIIAIIELVFSLRRSKPAKANTPHIFAKALAG
jgi:hypothetical protein